MSQSRKPRITVTQVLRLLLADDRETWDLAKWAEAIEWPDGVASRLKLAINLYRRAQFDMIAYKELMDRVDGKLAAAYSMPDDAGDVRVIQPILYVAPERPEQAERLFRAFDVSGEPVRGPN